MTWDFLFQALNLWPNWNWSWIPTHLKKFFSLCGCSRYLFLWSDYIVGLSRTSRITCYLILEQSSAKNILYKLEHVILKFLLAFFEWTNSYMIDFVMCKHVQTIFLGWDQNTFGLAHSESSVCKLLYLFVIVFEFSSFYFSFLSNLPERVYFFILFY